MYQESACSKEPKQRYPGKKHVGEQTLQRGLAFLVCPGRQGSRYGEQCVQYRRCRYHYELQDTLHHVAILALQIFCVANWETVWMTFKFLCN